MIRRGAIGAAVLVVMLAGCGGSDDGGSDPKDTTATAAGTATQTTTDAPPGELVDPCTILTDAELAEFGQDAASSKPVSSRTAGLTGCDWDGNVVGLRLGIGNESLEVFRARGNPIQFSVFEDIEIAGRPAILYSVDRSSTEVCSVSMELGSGVIDAQVDDASRLDTPQDLCGVPREVMKVIAAKLPPDVG